MTASPQLLPFVSDASQHLPFAKQGAKAPVGTHPALIKCCVCLLFRQRHSQGGIDVFYFFFHLILKKIKIAIREEEKQRGGKRVKAGEEFVSFVLLMRFILWQAWLLQPDYLKRGKAVT